MSTASGVRTEERMPRFVASHIHSDLYRVEMDFRQFSRAGAASAAFVANAKILAFEKMLAFIQCNDALRLPRAEWETVFRAHGWDGSDWHRFHDDLRKIALKGAEVAITSSVPKTEG